MVSKTKYPPNWKEIRSFVRQRDNNTCQHCGGKNGELRTSQLGRVYKCSLAVAHLDHDAENWQVKHDRLLLLCQACHLKYDKKNNSLKSVLASQQTKIKCSPTKNDLRQIIKQQELTIEKLMGQGFVNSDAIVIEPNDNMQKIAAKLKKLGVIELRNASTIAMELLGYLPQ